MHNCRGKLCNVLEARAGVEPTYTDLQTRPYHALLPRSNNLHPTRTVCIVCIHFFAAFPQGVQSVFSGTSVCDQPRSTTCRTALILNSEVNLDIPI